MNSTSKQTKIAHFDCQFGAAGDMLLSALLDAGVNYKTWLEETEKIALPPDSFRISINKVKRCSINASKIEIALRSEKSDSPAKTAVAFASAKKSAHGHSHEHEKQSASFAEQPDYNPSFLSNHHDHDSESRHLADILEIIERSKISVKAKDLAVRIFNRLAKAEAEVHGISTDEVHFHEVGAIDAIVDIIGFAIAYDLAEIQSASVSPMPLGSGTIKTAHGIFPVPSPAVIKLMQDAGAPSSSLSLPFECLTPTGAAILCEIAQSWGSPQALTAITASGYGAGSKNPAEWPNVVRVIFGNCEVQENNSSFDMQTISVIEANIDDQSPQALSYAVDKLFAAGALDVLLIPALMKKGRNGQLLSLVCLPEDETRLQELILLETSSIGVRSQQIKRMVAQRSWVNITMDDGAELKFKLASDRQGKIINVQPEFDELAKYAASKQISIKNAQQRAIAAYQAKAQAEAKVEVPKQTEAPANAKSVIAERSSTNGE